MTRIAVLALSAVILMGAAYGTTAYALGSGADGPQLRSDLPASNLPVTPLSGDSAVAISNLIGGGGGDTRFGITPDSYGQARRVALTSAGPLYLIPGTKGACLAFEVAVSCGDPGAADQPILALVAPSPSTGDAVGGGVTMAGITTVTIASANGPTRTASSARGVFTVSEQDHISLSTSSPPRFDGNP